MTYSNILFETKNAIAYVTVNRPKVLNALNMATMEELRAAFHDIKNDAGVRVSSLTGAGGRWSLAGGALGERASPAPAPAKGIRTRGRAWSTRTGTWGSQ